MSGCANQSLLSELKDLGLPPYTHLSDVPFFPQEPLLCGPAALATVINYYDHKTIPEDLNDRLWTPEAKGTFGVDMISATRAKGMLAIRSPDKLEDLLLVTSQGWPSIHLLNLGFKQLPQWHYAVLVGYDLDNEEVVLRSGKVRVRKMSFKHFMRSKALANNWAIIPAFPDQLPVLAEWELVYKELLSFTEVMPEYKTEAFSTAARTYRDQWQFLFAHGNNLFEMTQFNEATAAYQSALNLSNNASIWNNLSYSLVQQGCVDLAKEAIQCAGNISADDANISKSILEILSVQSSGSRLNVQCPSEIHCPVSSNVSDAMPDNISNTTSNAVPSSISAP